MIIPPLLAYFLWVPISLLLFRRYPMRIAFLLNFVGGWAVLPAARYVESGHGIPYWIIGTSLESEYFLTKATIVGFCGLLALLVFDRTSIQRFRLTVWDLPMGMWLLAPLLSSIANPGNLGEGFAGEIYQILAWGSPYLIGRLYFTDTKSLRLAAKAFVVGGLVYIPFCILEIFKGPLIYSHLYGYQPYQMMGAERFLGYRPTVLLENGNQLGVWMATATLIAIWLWHRKAARTIMYIPIFWVAISLFLVTIACQSTEAIIMLLVLIPFIFVDPRHLNRTVSIVLVVGILAFAAFRITNYVSIRDLVKDNPIAHSVSTYLKGIGKGSLEWRVDQDEQHINKALNEPILGFGTWNWWQEGPMRPWGLWLLTFGMYGSVGLVSLEALLLIPALRAVWFPLARSDIGYTNMRHTLSAAVLISAVDSLLNSTVVLPLLLVIGGMTVWSTTDTEVEVDYARNKASVGARGWRGSENAARKAAR
jgi:hypothetical protein